MLRINRYQPPKPVNVWKGPKPKLPVEVTLTCRVRSQDLQDYLATVFKMRGYDIRQVTGARADMSPEFVVTGILPDTPNMWQRIDNIRRGRKEHDLNLILNLLCRDGFIPTGKYVIDMTPNPHPIDAYRHALHQTSDPLCAECMKIKEANKSDKNFVKQTTMLDKKVAEYKSKLGGAPCE